MLALLAMKVFCLTGPSESACESQPEKAPASKQPTRCYTRDATKLLAQETPNKKVGFDKPNMWEPGYGGH